jgi:hypothetical protein
MKHLVMANDKEWSDGVVNSMDISQRLIVRMNSPRTLVTSAANCGLTGGRKT